MNSSSVIRTAVAACLRGATATFAAIALSAAPAAPAWGAPLPVGVLTQLNGFTGLTGCISMTGGSEDGAGTCTLGRGLAETESATVSPDGGNVYVGSYGTKGHESSLTVFARNPIGGALTQLPATTGCLTTDGASSEGAGTCTKARGLETAGDGHDVAISPDGQFLYLAAQNGGGTLTSAILIFRRDPSSGALTQLPGPAGCISQNGASQEGAGTCQTDQNLIGTAGLSMSSDGRFVYASDDGGASGRRLVAFARDAGSGALGEIQCLAQGAVAGCTTGRVLGDVQSLAITPDGLHAYGADYNTGVSVFDRDPATGLLTQKAGAAGCFSDTGKDDTGASTCTTGRVLSGSYALSVGLDGRTLYDGALSDKGIAIFQIGADGGLTQPAGAAGCVSKEGKDQTSAVTCSAGRALAPYGSAISPDGLDLYSSDDEGGEKGGIAAFAVGPGGALTQMAGPAGCFTASGNDNTLPGSCTNARAVDGGYGLGLSPVGESLYFAGGISDAVAIFTRAVAPVCAPAHASTTLGKTVGVKIACSDGNQDNVLMSVATPPAHGTVGPVDRASNIVLYTPAPGYSGPDTFTFTASDGTNTSAPATATVSVASTAPIVGGLNQSAARWRRGHALARIAARRRRAPVGTTFRFTLDQAATVRLTFTTRTSGRRSHGRCVAQTRRNRHARRCRRTVTAGTIVLGGHLGLNKVTFQGRVSRSRSLAPGSYTLLVSARNAAGQAGGVKRLSFTIVAH